MFFFVCLFFEHCSIAHLAPIGIQAKAVRKIKVAEAESSIISNARSGWLGLCQIVS